MKLLRFIPLVAALCLAMTFINFAQPSDGAYELSGYQPEYAAQAQTLMISSFGFVDNYDKMDTQQVQNNPQGARQQIVDLAIQIAQKFGNGVVGSNAGTTVEGAKIRYVSGGGSACSWCGDTAGHDYLTGWNTVYTNFSKLVDGSLDHMHFSCHCSTQFCWRYIWQDWPYGTHPSNFYRTYQSLDWGYHTNDEIYAVAQPGDIICNSVNGDSPGHSCLYIGPIDIDGAHFEHAIMNCGWGSSTNDWVIKEMPDRSSKKTVVISFDKAVQGISGGNVNFANLPAIADGDNT